MAATVARKVAQTAQARAGAPAGLNTRLVQEYRKAFDTLGEGKFQAQLKEARKNAKIRTFEFKLNNAQVKSAINDAKQPFSAEEFKAAKAGFVKEKRNEGWVISEDSKGLSLRLAGFL